MKKIIVGQANAIFQLRFVVPAQLFQLTHIQKLAGGAVRLCGVPFNRSGVPHNLSHQFRQFLDGQLFSSAQVHSLIAGVVIHQIHTGVGQIVHVQKLTQRRTRPPAGHRLCAAHFCLMEAPDQRGQHMAVLRMVVVVRAIEIGRHHTDVIGSVLAIQIFAVFQATDLRQCIGLVGLFQAAGQQAALRHGLRRHAGIDTA